MVNLVVNFNLVQKSLGLNGIKIFQPHANYGAAGTRCTPSLLVLRNLASIETFDLDAWSHLLLEDLRYMVNIVDPNIQIQQGSGSS